MLAGSGGLDLSVFGPSSADTFDIISYTGSPTFRTYTVKEPIEEKIAKNQEMPFIQAISKLR